DDRHRLLARLCRDLCARGAHDPGSGAMTAAALSLPMPRAQRLSLRRFLALLVVGLLIVWTAVPLFMAGWWWRVEPGGARAPPAVLPPSLSLAQWEYVFTYSEIVKAVATSFLLAPTVTVLSFILALPTAYALGRFSFPGKEALRILILLPIVMPPMVIAMFL